MHRRDRRLQCEPARRPAAQGGQHKVGALADLGLVPQGAVLVLEQDQAPVRRCSRCPPGIGQQQQRQQAANLAFVRHEFSEHAGEADRQVGEVGPDEVGSDRVGVTGRVKQVHDGEHGVKPVGQLGEVRDPVRDPGGRDFLLGPGHTGRHGGLGDPKRAGDLRRADPADQPQGQRDLRLPGQGRMAAGEDQP